jgi:succinyl-CoA synthetase alpha subunit
LVGGYADTWAAKVEALDAAGVTVARSLDQLPVAAAEALARAGFAPAAA